ncbi:MAG: hypothetical protein UHD09_06260 [Bifidobacterium sp.]|nr:hypothetical protein [Bifidobacterium sp.]
MSDNKAAYSAASRDFVDSALAGSADDKRYYDRAKRAEARFNEEWKQTGMVNLNEICDRFAPGARGKRVRGKFEFQGERYTVVADMSAGYVRIGKTLPDGYTQYLKLDGKPGDNKETHFKIKRREEMR